jgi:hypothetical protein
VDINWSEQEGVLVDLTADKDRPVVVRYGSERIPLDLVGGKPHRLVWP